MNPEERNRLFDDLLEGDISEADFLRLEAEMIVDEEVRAAYYDRLKLQTGLEKEAHAAATGTAGAVTPAAPVRRFDPLLVAAIGALLLLVAVLTWQMRQDAASTKVAEPLASGFGVIAETSGADWKGGGKLSRGDLIPVEPLQLTSGLVRVDLFSGVVFYLSGNASFSLPSEQELRLESGEARVVVPELEETFRVTTPAGELRGNGVEFSVATLPGLTSARVKQGTVQWRGNGFEETLSPGRMVTRGSDGPESPESGSLLSGREFAKELASDRTQRKARWKESRSRWQQDGRLLAYYSMDQSISGSSSTLSDLSPRGRDGSIIRAERSANRWGDPASALDFTPTGSRVRMEIPGEHQSLTLLCWAKIDSLDRLYNSLFLTDGHELHEPHWQIMNDGRMFFSVRARQEKGVPDKHIAFSPPIWKPTDGGKWMHLATVYDGRAQTITHYVNGEAVSIDSIPEELHPETVSIGVASIGNWSQPRYRTDPEFAVRNLNGSIDELALFSEALDAAEIRELYETGKP